MELFSGIFGSGDEEATAQLLAQRPELLDESRGCTIMHWVAEKGFAKISAQLLAQKPELANVLSHDNWTPLNYAVFEGHEAIVIQLLAHTSRSALLDSKVNVLDWALKNGRDTIMERLLDHCPELIETVKFSNLSSFYIAAYYGHDKAVAARRPKCDSIDIAPFLGAVHEGHDKVVALLLDYNPLFGATSSYDGSTALHEAAYRGHEKVIALLLTRSPKLIDVVDSRGNTALHSAVSSNDCKVLERLLACKPELIDAVNFEGETPLQYALRWQYASLTAIEFLLAAKPEHAYRVNRQGDTLLHTAVEHKHGKETIVEQVWRLNPAAVRVANHKKLTPCSRRQY